MNPNYLNTQINEILENSSLMPPKHRDIYRLRTGMDDGRIKTFSEIAYIFDLSTSTTRIYYKKAEKKILAILSEKVSNHETIIIDVSDVVEKAKKLTPYLIQHLKNNEEDLRKLHWQVFEHLVAEFFASWGYEDVRIVGRNSQTGADIIAIHREDKSGVKIRYFIEVKRWKDHVGVEVIDRVIGSILAERSKFGWHLGMIVTVADFTVMQKYTPLQLSMLGIELRNGSDVRKWLQEYKFYKQGLWLPEPFLT
ncbi:hypothetical protein BMF77_00230 [Dolichospermum sp. UHCC 0315A]|jgi:restriction endonuclease Mrr|uniref:restriction endonuclease n=1 Tax=Dolichospermum sp. UHCC 0315A TaxID=1914871 RepID=UPI0011E6772F|nr:restriction endonuclease [Dolichospermum sp. UHCC 0315A]QEI39677.1 hypothetical protein BMF77_00230 [Dolichospermum sp. UHCC 0315A]